MQRTSNYQLPTWEKSDRIMMEDFNDMTQKIEAAIDGAKSDAAAAQSTADSALSKQHCVAGHYKGTGQLQTIEVGFRPSAVLIQRRENGNNVPTGDATYLFLDTLNYTPIYFVDNGFCLRPQRSGDETYPIINISPYPFSYVAFR